MILRIIDWCERNRVLVFTGAILLTVAGAWCLQRVPLDALPDISDVQVIIHTEWAGEKIRMACPRLDPSSALLGVFAPLREVFSALPGL